MPLIDTPRPLSRPSAVISADISNAERNALGTREIALLVDAREAAEEYSQLTLRDRIGARPVSFNAGSFGLLNGRAAVDLPGTNSTYGLVDFQMPASYFFATAISLDNISDTQALISSPDTTGNRLLFSVGGGSGVRLDHGTAAGQNISTGISSAVVGPQVVWGTYDAPTGAAAFGVNSVAALVSGMISSQHKASAQTLVWGGAGNWAVPGKAGIAMVGDRYLGGDINAGIRRTLLAWCAEYAGVALAG